MIYVTPRFLRHPNCKTDVLTPYVPKSILKSLQISFEIEPHTFTVILGSSGAGKTTLLRCILQLLEPDKGHLWFQGQDLTTCSAKELQQARAQIATIAQQFNLVRRRSALENCLGGRLQELPLWRCWLGHFPHSLLKEGMAALERVQLLDVAFQRADRLSGGQQQRVAIARALTQRACLILADEPVASLDIKTAHAVLSLLRSLERC
ncbi:MAG TPA: phosphonate ABC transporter ATP-binding protein [Cyanobacteria bacterium UBA8543]|nr:phosphonate ABC transporter ATP-binding protein [Cyanobacteria bacterium UBA8543]